MTDTAVQEVLSAIDAGRLRRHLEWFAAVRRDTGGEGEERASDYIRDQLAADGVPLQVHEFDAFLSYPRAATLTLPDGKSFPTLTHSFAAPTGAEGVTAELVTANPGSFAHASGRIALVNGLAMPVTILQASRAGCAGLVFTNEDRVVHNMIGTTIWGTPGIDQLDRLPKIPVVSVGRDSGDVLRARLAAEPGLKVTVAATVETDWYRSRLPEVRIAGTKEAERFILLGGHYCAWEVGVTDNATGNACLLEVARLLWRSRERLGRSVRICWWPGHSHGRYSGSTWYADTFFTEIAECGIAYHNVDSPGVRDATRYVARHTSAELESFCRGVIEQVTGQPNVPAHRPARAADQAFLANGLPSYSAYPFLPVDHADFRPWTGGSANAYWWHTEEDTLDKADVDVLALDVRVTVTAILALANAVLLPLDYDATGRELVETLESLQQTAGSALDLGPAIDEARAFAAAAEGLAGTRADIAGQPQSAARFNELVTRLGRVLNPIIYSQSGRFQHDAADWAPVMKHNPRVLISGLLKVTQLAELAGQRELGFLQAQLVRERNRVVTALREARRLIAELDPVAAAASSDSTKRPPKRR